MSALIFVSYAREDSAIVKTLVQTMRAAMHGLVSGDRTVWELVFLDTDNLTPGVPWKEQLESAIKNAEKVFVCWCEHSAASSAVGDECDLAFELDKPVVPLLLDDTPLPERLGATQGVDVRPFHAVRRSLKPYSPVVVETLVDGLSSALDLDRDQMLQVYRGSAMPPGGG